MTSPSGYYAQLPVSVGDYSYFFAFDRQQWYRDLAVEGWTPSVPPDDTSRSLITEQIDIFSTPGLQTWTKPPGARFHHIYLWGAGAGGQSGSAPLTGGGGGSGGGYIEAFVVSSLLAATVDLTVGAGGISDSNGGLTAFYSSDPTGLVAYGGHTDGSISNVGIGAVGNQSKLGGAGGVSAAGGLPDGVAGSSLSDNNNAAGGSGGGGGGNNNDGAQGNQQNMGYLFGGTAGDAGTPDGGAGVDAPEYATYGGSGGGGAYGTGVGGAGGHPAGGGGGGATDGVNATAGGSGANGQIMIITLF